MKNMDDIEFDPIPSTAENYAELDYTDPMYHERLKLEAKLRLVPSDNLSPKARKYVEAGPMMPGRRFLPREVRDEALKEFRRMGIL